MKTGYLLLIIFFLLSVSPTKQDRNMSYFIFYNCDCLQPYSNTEASFWEDETSLDTIIIVGGSLNRSLDKKISRLTLLSQTKKDLDIGAAIVRIRHGKIKDTLYSTFVLNYWQNQSGLYHDSTDFFRKNYSHYFLPFGGEK